MPHEDDKLIPDRARKDGIPAEVAEGIKNQVDSTGHALGKAISISDTTVVDVLSEGEIEGLTEYELIGEGTEGQIGFDKVTKKTFSEIRTQAASSGVKFLKSISYNDLPLVNGLDQFNYQQIAVNHAVGSANGGIANGIDQELEVVRTIGERLRGHPDNFEEFAKVYKIENSNCKGVTVNIKVQSLVYTEKKSKDNYGDIRDTSIEYEVFYRPVFDNKVTDNPVELAFTSTGKVEVTGKVQSPYIKTTTVNFDAVPNIELVNHIGWEIKIVRYTIDSLSSDIHNTTLVDSIQEIYGNIYRYPHSATVESRFSAEFFTRVPKRSYDVRLKKVKVPVDYDPVLKRYGQSHNGVANPYWNGEFKSEKAWSDNPVWCYYDLLTNKRYGLGKFLDETYLDKWTLYEIAKYCDQMVPDGYGGVEPRFTLNMLINSRTEAFRLINDLTSVFRGIAYYFAGQIHTTVDRPKDHIMDFNNTNVVGGEFVYSSSAKRTRATVAVVSYRNKREDFAKTVEYVEDTEGIRRFGVRTKEISGVGITSKGQARRLGYWSLFTGALDTETVTFTTGLEGTILKPGDIIKISDSARNTKRYCGRCHVNVSSGAITIDDDDFSPLSSSVVQGVTVSYKLEIVLPSYRVNPAALDLSNSYSSNTARANDLVNSQVISFTSITPSQITTSGNSKIITLNSTQRSSTGFIELNAAFDNGYIGDGPNFDNNIATDLVWVLEPEGSTANLASEKTSIPKEYRIINIEEKEGGTHGISAVEYTESKFSNIDQFESYANENEVNADPTVNAPTAILLEAQQYTQNTDRIKYTVVPSDTVNVFGYIVYVKIGSDFNGADFLETDNTLTASDSALNSIPDRKYLVGSLSPEDLSNFFIPTSEATYFFRVYSVNRLGTPSTTNANDSIAISNIKPWFDTTISRLTLSTASNPDKVRSELAGNTTTQITDVVEPVIVWETSVAGLNDDIIFDYKITIRPPSSNNRPSTTIFKTITLSDLTPENLTYTYTFDDQIEVANAHNGGRPLRDYDIVVEAFTEGGDGSAQFGSDGVAQNPLGYDILNIENPQLRKIPLTDPAEGEQCIRNSGLPPSRVAISYPGIQNYVQVSNPTSEFCTKQWLNADKQVVVQFLHSPTNFLEQSEIAGGILAYSDTDFQSSIDSGNISSAAHRSANGIVLQSFTNTAKGTDTVTIPTIIGENKGFVSIAFADALDIRTRNSLGLDSFAESLISKMSDTVFVEDNVPPPKDFNVTTVDYGISNDTTINMPSDVVFIQGYIRFSMNEDNGARAEIQFKNGSQVISTIKLGGAAGGDRTGNVWSADPMTLTYKTGGGKKSPVRNVPYTVDNNVNVDSGQTVQDTFCVAIPQGQGVNQVRIFRANGGNQMIGAIQQLIRFNNPQGLSTSTS